MSLKVEGYPLELGTEINFFQKSTFLVLWIFFMKTQNLFWIRSLYFPYYGIYARKFNDLDDFWGCRTEILVQTLLIWVNLRYHEVYKLDIVRPNERTSRYKQFTELVTCQTWKRIKMAWIMYAPSHEFLCLHVSLFLKVWTI